MEAAFPTPLALRLEAVAHRVRPDFPGGTEFRDLLEEVVMRVEEEAEPWRESVDCEAALARPFDILNAVPQGKREFLNSCRSRLSDVITADRDRIKARNVIRRELDDIGDQPH